MIATAYFRGVDLGLIQHLEFIEDDGLVRDVTLTTSDLGWEHLVKKAGPLVAILHKRKTVTMKTMRLARVSTDISRGMANHRLRFEYAGKRLHNRFVSIPLASNARLT